MGCSDSQYKVAHVTIEKPIFINKDDYKNTNTVKALHKYTDLLQQYLQSDGGEEVLLDIIKGLKLVISSTNLKKNNIKTFNTILKVVVINIDILNTNKNLIKYCIDGISYYMVLTHTPLNCHIMRELVEYI